MKKILTAAILTALSFSSLFAIEISGIISDSSGFKFDENSFSNTSLSQSETLVGDMKVPILKNGSIYFIGEITLTHAVSGPFSKLSNSFTADIALAKINGSRKINSAANINFAAGRFSLSDITSTIYSQNADGIFGQFASKKFESSLYFGYTGLLNSKIASILKSNGDLFIPSRSGGFLDVYNLAAPYAVSVTTFSLPYLFANQTITAEIFGAYPLPGIIDSAKDKDIRLYGTLALNGPVMNNLFYSASATVETAGFDDIALLAKANLSLFPDLLSSSVAASVTYASGNNGALIPFTSFSKTSSTLCKQQLSYSGIFKAGLSGSAVPAEKLFCSIGTDIVFDCYMPGAFEYYGTQAAFAVNYQLFSDVSFGLNATSFFANDPQYSKTEVSVTAAIAL